MIPQQETRFDFYGRSFFQITRSASSAYELDEHERENLEIIERLLAGDGYSGRDLVDAHIDYVNEQLNRLSGIKRQEAEFFPNNADLDSMISRLMGISRKLFQKTVEIA